MEWCADAGEVLRADSHNEAPIGKCTKTDVSKDGVQRAGIRGNGRVNLWE